LRILIKGFLLLNKSYYIFFVFVLGWSVSCFCDKIVKGKYGGEFLSIGVGARPLSMGGAYTAAVEDVTGIYWNPAGLISMKTIQLHGMHSERFSGIVNWDFAGVGLPLDNTTAIGLGFFRLGVDGIQFTALRNPSLDLGEEYIDESGRRTLNIPYIYKTIYDNEMAFIFSFAKKSAAKFSYGGNIKVIRKKAGEYNAWGLGFDFGIMLNPFHTMKLGVVLVDGTSTMLAWNGGRRELILPHLKLGMAYPVRVSWFDLLSVFDMSFNMDMGVDICGGLELSYKKRAALRMGLNNGQFTTGAGIKLAFIELDYGFSSHMDLGDTHRISLTFFGDKDIL
jgi:hypothetical protein